MSTGALDLQGMEVHDCTSSVARVLFRPQDVDLKAHLTNSSQVTLLLGEYYAAPSRAMFTV